MLLYQSKRRWADFSITFTNLYGQTAIDGLFLVTAYSHVTPHMVHDLSYSLHCSSELDLITG